MVESMIIESLQMFGQDLLYLPRTLVSKDELLGEDRLSIFQKAYPIEMYLEDGHFAGSGNFISKFGLMIDQTATFVVSQKRWLELVGMTGNDILPNRPAEGDLIYHAKSDQLFQIQFVHHQTPFYQLGKLYVYRLDVQMFRYASERMTTGVSEVDAFQSLRTMDTNAAASVFGEVDTITITNAGTKYSVPPIVTFSGGAGSGASASAEVGSGGSIIAITITSGGTGYTSAPTVIITPASGDTTGTGAQATCTVSTNPDKPSGYGNNTTFEAESENIIFSENNPFGDID